MLTLASNPLTFCFRNPIPNDYTLTLEINRDRTTVAKHFKCNSQNSRLPACPLHLDDGDYFLYRSTNEACQKMVSLYKSQGVWTQVSMSLDKLWSGTVSPRISFLPPYQYPLKDSTTTFPIEFVLLVLSLCAFISCSSISQTSRTFSLSDFLLFIVTMSYSFSLI